MATYTPIYGTITSVSPMMNQDNSVNGCSLLYSIMTNDSGPANLVITGKTYVEGQETLEAGDYIVAFYDSSQPLPLIYPPQYRPLIVAELEESPYAAFDYFDQQLLNRDRTLQLNLNNREMTEVLLANGQTYFGNPAGNYLLVFYTTTTRSIPAATVPEKVIVFCSSDR